MLVMLKILSSNPFKMTFEGVKKDSFPSNLSLNSSSLRNAKNVRKLSMWIHNREFNLILSDSDDSLWSF